MYVNPWIKLHQDLSEAISFYLVDLESIKDYLVVGMTCVSTCQGLGVIFGFNTISHFAKDQVEI